MKQAFENELVVLIIPEYGRPSFIVKSFVNVALFRPHQAWEWESLPGVKVGWQIPNFSTVFVSYAYSRKSVSFPQLQLVDIPAPARVAFSPDDPVLPFQIAGCVLLIDAHEAYLRKTKIENPDPDLAQTIRRLPLREYQVSEIRKQLRHPKDISIEWIRKHKLSYVVAMTTPNTPFLTIDDIREFFDIEPQVPIIVCSPDPKIDEPELFLHYPFQRKDIEQILTVFIEHLKGDNGSSGIE